MNRPKSMCNADRALIGTRDSLGRQFTDTSIEDAILLNCHFHNGKQRDEHRCEHCFISKTNVLNERAWTFPDGSELRVKLVLEALSPAAVIKRPLLFGTEERCTWITDEEIFGDDEKAS